MMGKKLLAGILLLVTFASTSCNKLEEFVETLKPEDLTDISYGAHSSNTMDVYLPSTRSTNTRVIILVHGGSWFMGDKSEFTEYAKTLRQKGFAVVNMNYRLTHTNEKFGLDEQLSDLSAAVDFVAAKAGEWKISSDKFGMLGASAGAHLAMLYTYSANSDDKVKTVVSLAGPANLVDTRNVNMSFAAVVEWLLGTSLTASPQTYRQASPINKVTASSKPTLIFHGKMDNVVPVQQSIDLKAKLDQENVKSKLVLFDTTGHEVISTENVYSVMSEVSSWFETNIN